MNKYIHETVLLTCVEERWNGRWKNIGKKSITLFCFPVKDIKIPDIFSKIKNFIRASWASAITHIGLLNPLSQQGKQLYRQYLSGRYSKRLPCKIEKLYKVSWTKRAWIRTYGGKLKFDIGTTLPQNVGFMFFNRPGVAGVVLLIWSTGD